MSDQKQQDGKAFAWAAHCPGPLPGSDPIVLFGHTKKQVEGMAALRAEAVEAFPLYRDAEIERLRAFVAELDQQIRLDDRWGAVPSALDQTPDQRLRSRLHGIASRHLRLLLDDLLGEVEFEMTTRGAATLTADERASLERALERLEGVEDVSASATEADRTAAATLRDLLARLGDGG